MKKTLFLSSLLTVMLTFTACSSHDKVVSDQSAIFWYHKIIKHVANANVSAADDAYSSLYSEHVSSPLLPQAMLLLAKAHAYYDELVLAKYYLDEYLKRFGNSEEREYVAYLKVKIDFIAYRHPFRNQKFLHETIDSVTEFLSNYPDSYYEPLVKQMLLQLELGRETLKEEIVSLYDRINKPKAAEYYRHKNRLHGINMKEVTLPERSWLRNIFE